MISSATSKKNTSNQDMTQGIDHHSASNSVSSSDPISVSEDTKNQLSQPLTISGNILTPQEIEKKLKLSMGLFEAAYEIKKHQLRKKHPEKSEKELNHLTMSLIEKGTR